MLLMASFESFIYWVRVYYVIVKSHYECNSNDNLWVQVDLTGFYPIVFDVCHIMQ